MGEPHYLHCKGNAAYELAHNMFGKAVENIKSHTIPPDSFTAEHQYIQV